MSLTGFNRRRRAIAAAPKPAAKVAKPSAAQKAAALEAEKEAARIAKQKAADEKQASKPAKGADDQDGTKTPGKDEKPEGGAGS